MFRRLAFLFAFLSLIVAALITIACGGSSNGTITQGCTGGPYDVTGDWTLTITGGGTSSSGPGVITPSGLAVFFQTTTTVPAPGDTLAFPSISGACAFSGTANAFATPFTGGGSATETVQGTISSATSISGAISNGSSFSLSPNSALTGPVQALSGNGWLAQFEGGSVAILFSVFLSPTGNNNSMTFTATGTLPDNSTCFMSGTLNQEAGNVANLNVFSISITSVDVGCPIGATVTGVGFESDTDYFNINGNASGTYFYAAPSTGAFVLEIYQ